MSRRARGYIAPCEVCGKLISVSALHDMDLCMQCASLLRDDERVRRVRLVVSKRGRERKKPRDEGA